MWEHGGPNLSAQATDENCTEGCSTWRILPYHSEIRYECRNPRFKAISWQEGRQANANSETECLRVQKSLLLSPTEAGRFATCRILGQLARYSSCPEENLAVYCYLLVLLVLSIVKDMETFSFSPWLVGLVESWNRKRSSCFPVIILSHIRSWYGECTAY